MAHPCIYCDGDCFCNGDYDDVITSKTPKDCEGCGCHEDEDDDLWDDLDDEWEDDIDDPDHPLNPPNNK